MKNKKLKSLVDEYNLQEPDIKWLEYFSRLVQLNMDDALKLVLDPCGRGRLSSIFPIDFGDTVIENGSFKRIYLGYKLGKIKTLSFSLLPYLKELSIVVNSIYELDLSNNSGLEILSCSHNNISNLDLYPCLNLKHLNFGKNNLSDIYLGYNLELEVLDVAHNKIRTMDISKLQKLKALNCGDNLLTSIDFSNNRNLKSIQCYKNQIQNLDVSQNSELEYLACDENRLFDLDLSHNKKLRNVCYKNNPLDQVKIDSAQNVRILEGQ